jgi:hypothetical protein
MEMHESFFVSSAQRPSAVASVPLILMATTDDFSPRHQRIYHDPPLFSIIFILMCTIRLLWHFAALRTAKKHRDRDIRYTR